MTMRGFTIGVTALFLGLVVVQPPALQAQGAAKKKVFIDQDLGGAMGTDNQSMLMLLQAPELDIVGIGIVAGDGQVKASTGVDAANVGADGVRSCAGGAGRQVPADQYT